ncbi:unnamed protein product [Calypogeia fissa]
MKFWASSRNVTPDYRFASGRCVWDAQYIPILLDDLDRKIMSDLATDAKDLLQFACYEASKRCRKIFQSPFTVGSSTNSSSKVSASAERYAFTDVSKSKVRPQRNGLVDTAVLAYNNHHHLIIGADDVWIAILSEFNLYVNANAETLRHFFVDHEGKQNFVVTLLGNHSTVHFGKFAKTMSNLIQKKVKDKDLREWIIPTFSTMTDNDRIVSSIIMMATLKAYFSYDICSLSAMTLRGKKAGWQKLLSRVEKIRVYGTQTEQWHSLLKPVPSAVVRPFEEPDSQRTKEFLADHCALQWRREWTNVPVGVDHGVLLL